MERKEEEEIVFQALFDLGARDAWMNDKGSFLCYCTLERHNEKENNESK